MTGRLSRHDLDHVLEHTSGSWADLRGERLFLTGGTGFYGTWLLETFLWANERLRLGARAVVLTRDPQAFRTRSPHLAEHASISLWPGDVRSFEPPPGTFSFVVHAATPSTAALEPEALVETIVKGTRRTLDMADRGGTRRLLFTSSGAVYGRQPPELSHVDETYGEGPDPLDARSSYGEAKRLAELLVARRSEEGGPQGVIARGFAFVGPHLPLDAHFAIGNFIRDGLQGSPIEVRGDGTPYRSYLYAADLAIWLWTLLFRGKGGRAYNVGSEDDLPLRDLASRIAAYFGTEVKIAGTALENRPAERYVPSTARAREELGLRARVPLDEAIRLTAEWHRERGVISS